MRATAQKLHIPVSLAMLLGFWLLVAPGLAPYDPMLTQPARQFEAPSAEHPLGTDQLGRDILSRILYGGQRTLAIAVTAAALASLFGTAIGLIAASSGVSAMIAAAAIRVLLALPGLLVALILMTLLSGSASALVLATGIAQIAPVARVVQTSAGVVLRAPHVEAAQALGAAHLHIYLHHILPLIGTVVAAAALLAFAQSLLNSAALTFLGIGSTPGLPDWGAMLFEGRQAFRTAPWVGLAPGAAITSFIWLASLSADILAFQSTRAN